MGRPDEPEEVTLLDPRRPDFDSLRLLLQAGQELHDAEPKSELTRSVRWDCDLAILDRVQKLGVVLVGIDQISAVGL